MTSGTKSKNLIVKNKLPASAPLLKSLALCLDQSQSFVYLESGNSWNVGAERLPRASKTRMLFPVEAGIQNGPNFPAVLWLEFTIPG